MAIDALGTVANTTSALTNSGISQDQFLQILLTQLRFQDPLKPMDNEQFVAQLAQFSALEVNQEQSAKIDSLLSMQAASQAVTLIGRSVELQGANAGQVGTVTAISFSSGQPQLTVTTSAVTLTNVNLSDVSLVTDLSSNSSTQSPTTPTIPDPTNQLPSTPTIPDPSTQLPTFPSVPTVPNPLASLPGS